jgi:hypothetical protein
MGEVWIGYKRLILKLSKVLRVEEVEGPFMHPYQRLIPLQKWYNPRDIQLTRTVTQMANKRGKTTLKIIGVYRVP